MPCLSDSTSSSIDAPASLNNPTSADHFAPAEKSTAVIMEPACSGHPTQPADSTCDIATVPCLSVGTSIVINADATWWNAATVSASSNAASHNRDHNANNAMEESGAAKRSSAESVLDLAIASWNTEVDRVISLPSDAASSSHSRVIGDLDSYVTPTAMPRLDALRERVLARIYGKQRRLDTG